MLTKGNKLINSFYIQSRNIKSHSYEVSLSWLKPWIESFYFNLLKQWRLKIIC